MPCDNGDMNIVTVMSEMCCFVYREHGVEASGGRDP